MSVIMFLRLVGDNSVCAVFSIRQSHNEVLDCACVQKGTLHHIRTMEARIRFSVDSSKAAPLLQFFFARVCGFIYGVCVVIV